MSEILNMEQTNKVSSCSIFVNVCVSAGAQRGSRSHDVPHHHPDQRGSGKVQSSTHHHPHRQRLWQHRHQGCWRAGYELPKQSWNITSVESYPVFYGGVRVVSSMFFLVYPCCIDFFFFFMGSSLDSSLFISLFVSSLITCDTSGAPVIRFGRILLGWFSTQLHSRCMRKTVVMGQRVALYLKVKKTKSHS